MLTIYRIIASGFILLFALGEAAGQTAAHFKTPGAYLEVAPSQSVMPSEFTVEFWLMVRELGDPDQANGEQTVFDNRDGEQAGLNIRLAGTEFPISVFGFVSPFGGVGSPRVIHRHTWHHVAVTYGADSVRIYVEGELVGADSANYESASTIPLRIGEFVGFPWASLGLRGDLDEVRIWNHVRTGEELRAGMHERMSGAESGLVAYWDFERAEEGWTPDGTPNGNDAMAVGQVRFVPSYAPVGFVPPPVPTGLRAHGDDASITLHWKSLRDEAAGYALYRGTEDQFDASDETLLATLTGRDSLYVDRRVVAGFRYFYRLRSRDTDDHPSQPGRTAAGGTTTDGGYRVGVYYYPTWG
jgi:hypothetical protein